MALRQLGDPSSETCNTVTLRTDQLLVQPNDIRCSVSHLPYVIPTTTLNVAHFLHGNIVRLNCQLTSSTNERVQKFCPNKNWAPVFPAFANSHLCASDILPSVTAAVRATGWIPRSSQRNDSSKKSCTMRGVWGSTVVMKTDAKIMRKWKWPFLNGCQHNRPMSMATLFPKSDKCIKAVTDHTEKQRHFFFFSTTVL